MAALAAITTVRATTGIASRGRSVWDGVYTDAQAKRGGQVYAAHCVSCHGDTLQGDGPATALAGSGFTADFNGATLGEMVDRTRRTMPDDNPGTLSRQQVTDVLAYVLSVNKFPAGETELPTQAEVLNQITFLATKPTNSISALTDRPDLVRRIP
jgi:mono/diheme cytochrome c family protein